MAADLHPLRQRGGPLRESAPVVPGGRAHADDVRDETGIGTHRPADLVRAYLLETGHRGRQPLLFAFVHADQAEPADQLREVAGLRHRHQHRPAPAEHAPVGRRAPRREHRHDQLCGPVGQGQIGPRVGEQRSGVRMRAGRGPDRRLGGVHPDPPHGRTVPPAVTDVLLRPVEHCGQIVPRPASEVDGGDGAGRPVRGRRPGHHPGPGRGDRLERRRVQSRIQHTPPRGDHRGVVSVELQRPAEKARIPLPGAVEHVPPVAAHRTGVDRDRAAADRAAQHVRHACERVLAVLIHPLLRPPMTGSGTWSPTRQQPRRPGPTGLREAVPRPLVTR